MAIDPSIKITVIIDVLLDKPVRVVTSADATILPASWPNDPIRASF